MPTPRKPPAAHKPNGRPPFNPTADDREKVKRFLECGYKRATIAAYFEIHLDTLEEHFKEELRTARMDLLRRGMSKFQLAVLDGEEWAIKFLLANTAHGREFDAGFSTRTELTAAGGADLFQNMNLSSLSDADYAALKAILARAGFAVSDPTGGSAAGGASA